MAQSRVQGTLYSVGVVRHVETAGGRFVPVADARTVGENKFCLVFLMLFSPLSRDSGTFYMHVAS